MKMIINITGIILSIIIGIIFICFLRKKDKYEPESYLPLIIVTFLGGLLSIGIATGIYSIIKWYKILWIIKANEPFNKFLYSLFVIGPVEEFSKFISFFMMYPYIKKHFNETTDGLIYISCIALGFSIIENYYYANIGKGSEYLMIVRLLFCTPAHISFSIFMGIGFYNFFKINKKIKYLIKPLIVSITIHGLYDTLVLYEWAGLIFIIYFQMMLIVSKSLLEYTGAISEFRPTLNTFIKNYKNPTLSKHFDCLNCGSTNPKLTYYGNNFIIQKCDKCDKYVSNLESILNMFKYFSNTEIPSGSYFPRYKKFSRISKEYLWTVMNENYISPKLKIGYFDLNKLNNYFELINNVKIDTIKSLILKMII